MTKKDDEKEQQKRLELLEKGKPYDFWNLTYDELIKVSPAMPNEERMKVHNFVLTIKSQERTIKLQEELIKSQEKGQMELIRQTKLLVLATWALAIVSIFVSDFGRAILKLLGFIN